MTTQNLKKKSVAEMRTKAIIDTAYTKTVTSEEWLLSYLMNLVDTFLKQV